MDQREAERKKTRKQFWVGMAFLAVIVVGSCTAIRGQSDDAPQELDTSGALAMCQMALKRASRDPDKAEIPYVPDRGSGDIASFSWGPDTKMARMRNGLGLDVATSAACTVNKSQRRITSLTLDDKTVN